MRIHEKEVVPYQDYWLVYEEQIYHVAAWWFERAAMYEFFDLETDLFVTRDFALNPENWKEDFFCMLWSKFCLSQHMKD